MSGKIQFLDTNILVYAYSEDDPQKRDVARSLISPLVRRIPKGSMNIK